MANPGTHDATDDDLVFSQESAGVAAVAKGPAPWRVMVVDDDQDVHAVTRMALANVTFKDRSIEIISAMSGEQGYALLARERNIALVLLDVVMETDDAGLRLARRIREELKNHLVRIVLRTGQPGQAPEQRVIADYDINDYKTKSELTLQKLFTTVIASLRGYEGLQTIERNRLGLDKILAATSNLYQLDSLKALASGVLTQVGAILDFGAEGVLCVMRAKPQEAVPAAPLVIASTGGAAAGLHEQVRLPGDHAWSDTIAQAFRIKKSIFLDTVSVLFIEAAHGHQFVLAFAPPWPLSEIERNLLHIFCDRMGAAFDNLQMFTLLKATQEATVVAMTDLAETRDAATGGHVRRVCKLTEAIALELQKANTFPQETTPAFMACVGLASILHDVGKVATPDAVLLKPGRLTPQERLIMEEHAAIGEAVLARASDRVEGINALSMAAQIAGGHHEHFDGRGYPRGLAGTKIPLAARIVAVVDVFDALLHTRPYKEPWTLEKVLAYLHERKGTQFDTHVVEALETFIDTQKPDWITAQGQQEH